MQDNFDVVVIGSGPGGYVAAIKAAQLGLKTACIEKHQVLGGTCLNVGCIPSKALLQSSELYDQLNHTAKTYGILADVHGVDFGKMMQHKQSIITGFNQGIEGLFKKNKVTKFQGAASFINPHEVEVVGKGTKSILSSKYFIIATGSKPTPLPFLPFDEKKVLSSTGILSLERIPKKLIVIGAGVIGVELGSVYRRLGAEVMFLEFLGRVCPTLDVALSQNLQKSLEKQGMQFYLNTKVTWGQPSNAGIVLKAEVSKEEKIFEAQQVLVAIGRKPYTVDLGLEKVGIAVDSKGFIPVDGNFRTNHSHILAIGDVIEGPMLAHKAEEEGFAAAQILAGMSPKVDYMTIPSVVYTMPEVASVGLTEEEVKAKGISFKVAQFPFKANSRARCIGEGDGFVKIIAESVSLKILGVHIIGPHAGELIAEATLAMHCKLSASTLAHTCHAHPTLSEAIKEAALMIDSKALHI